MKNYVLKTTVLTIILALVFSSCSKNNIKKANKYIIGTWTFASENNESHYEGIAKYDEIINNCDDMNLEDSKTMIDRTYSYNNKKFTLTYLKTLTYSGETYTTEIDTVVVVDSPSTITFNEDGTCIIKKYVAHLDIPFENPYFFKYDYSEMTGTWNWIDSYNENTGIRIIFQGQNGIFSNFNIINMTIKEIDKNRLEYSYTYNNKYIGNNTTSGFCMSGLEYSYKYTFTTTDNGSGLTILTK